MRTVYFFLIFLISLLANSAISQTNLFQARGLKKGLCYEEVASLYCQKNCILNLFPATQAQITLKIKDLSKKNRMIMGHLFQTQFKVLNAEGYEVSILSLRPVSSKQYSSTGILRPQHCP